VFNATFSNISAIMATSFNGGRSWSVQLNIVVPYIVEETGKREAFLTFRVFSLEDVKK
jgi:hypothetical protein